MNILFITPHLPYPLTFGDRLRTYVLIKNIKRRYPESKITLLTFNDEFCTQENIHEIIQLGIEVILSRKDPYYSSLLFFLKNIFKYPFLVFKFYSKTLIHDIELVVSKEQFDILYVSTLHMVVNILASKTIKKTNCIIDFVDSKSLYIDSIMHYEPNVLKKIVLKRELKYVKRLEQIAAQNFPALLVISRKDKTFIERFSICNNIHIVRIAYELPKLYTYVESISKIKTSRKTTLFLSGNFEYLPNADALHHFLKDIFPNVLSIHPNIVLMISGPGIERRRIQTSPHIVSLGFIKNTEQYLQELVHADIVVSPVRLGSGIKTKIIEAMYFGKPIICYEVSNQGLDAKNNEEMLIVADSKEFTRGLNDLISNEGLRQKLSRNAKIFITHYLEDDPINYCMDLFKNIANGQKA